MEYWADNFQCSITFIPLKRLLKLSEVRMHLFHSGNVDMKRKSTGVINKIVRCSDSPAIVQWLNGTLSRLFFVTPVLLTDVTDTVKDALV